MPMVVTLENRRPPHLFHHVQSRAKRQPEANQRHHQQHMAAVIVENQLHQQDIQTGENHPTTRHNELITAPR
jgi:hypothetical protein